MTEPTWEDELLQRWIAGFDDVNRGLFLNLINAAPYTPPRDSGPLRVLEWVGQFSSYRADAVRLRSLIDAELAGARRAKEVAKVWANPTSTLPPDAWDMGAKRAANAVLEAFDGK